MGADNASIQFHEHPDADLPDVFRIQVLDFLRIVWPDMDSPASTVSATGRATRI